MNENELPKKGWSHGPIWSKWRWSIEFGVYYFQTFQEPPSMICLGDRMMHADWGIDTYGFLWKGSTTYDWHGGPSISCNLKDCIDWVKQAKWKELGCKLWSCDWENPNLEGKKECLNPLKKEEVI